MTELAKELEFDPDKTIEDIVKGLRSALRKPLNRRGLVVAISGGIDSSVCVALAVRALGVDRVFGLLLPEEDSSSTGLDRGTLVANHLGIEYLEHNITGTLAAIGCYSWRDDAIREVFPDYSEDWKNKIVIRGGLKGQVNHFMLVVENPAGEQFEENLPLNAYRTIVAATNYKQRIRKTIEYFHADRLNFAVVGTPNRLEYDQGFFVKNGDGSADVKPIAHLYKSQVYRLAEHMKLPDEICSAIPTTDTYSLDQGQDEFYFALPYQKMDLALWYHNSGRSAGELAERLGLEEKEAELVYRDIDSKRSASAYLHASPVLMESIGQVP